MRPAGPRVPALTILFHPNLNRVGERAILWTEDTGQPEACLARRELLFHPPAQEKGTPLEDPYLSRRAIRFAAARFGGIRIDCTRTGTRVIANDDWISDDRVFLGVEVERGVVLLLSERLALLLHNLDPDHDEAAPHFGLVGDSAPMLRMRRAIDRLARETSPALLRGEAGCGKKAVARAIHDAGSDGPFVIFDPSFHGTASVDELLSEAAGGTLLIDAVDEMPVEVQAEILRAWRQDRGIRLLAAGLEIRPKSAGPLLEEMSWTMVEVPALTQCRDDVGRLTFHFLRQELEKSDALGCLEDRGPFAAPWFPVRLMATMASYEWPSNIRQLRQVARRLARDYHDREQIDTRLDVNELLEGGAESTSTGWGWSLEDPHAPPSAEPVRKVGEIEILAALRAHRWQAEPAAAHLGISPEALFTIMEEFFNKE